MDGVGVSLPGRATSADCAGRLNGRCPAHDALGSRGCLRVDRAEQDLGSRAVCGASLGPRRARGCRGCRGCLRRMSLRRAMPELAGAACPGSARPETGSGLAAVGWIGAGRDGRGLPGCLRDRLGPRRAGSAGLSAAHRSAPSGRSSRALPARIGSSRRRAAVWQLSGGSALAETGRGCRACLRGIGAGRDGPGAGPVCGDRLGPRRARAAGAFCGDRLGPRRAGRRACLRGSARAAARPRRLSGQPACGGQRIGPRGSASEAAHKNSEAGGLCSCGWPAFPRARECPTQARVAAGAARAGRWLPAPSAMAMILPALGGRQVCRGSTDVCEGGCGPGGAGRRRRGSPEAGACPPGGVVVDLGRHERFCPAADAAVRG